MGGDNLPVVVRLLPLAYVPDTSLAVTLLGAVSANGLIGAIQGDSMLSLSTLNPADSRPVDGRITLQEVMAYSP